MRLIHTSDWHLGRTLHGADQLDAQATYLAHLIELARAERPAAVLVAGDIFDRAVPPLEAVTLLGESLARLAEVTQVVLIPGNHDSPSRLGYGSALWREQVRLHASASDVGEPVTVMADGERADIYPIPYLDPDLGRVQLAAGDQELARSHQAVLGAAMGKVRAAISSRPPAMSVVMAHAFVVGGQACDSERDIRVGGVDSVAAGTFADIGYVALGHLHGPQQVPVPGGLGRYAGSPLAYSFSEMNQVKSTALITLSPGGQASAELIAAPVPRPLAEIRGPIAELLGPRFERHTADYLRAIATDAVRPELLVPRVKDRFPYALQVLHEPPEREQRQVIRVVAASDPLDVATDFFKFATGGPPTKAEAEVLRDALADARRAEDGEAGA